MRTSMMLAMISGTLLLAACCPCRSAQAPRSRPAGPALPEIATGGVKVYTGTDGIRVDVLRLKDGTYLLHPTGSASLLDGRVLPCKHAPETAYREVWTTRYDGNEIAILTRMSSHQGNARFRLTLPGDRVLVQADVTYSEERSRTLDVRAVLALHVAQREDGRQATWQRFDVARRKRREEEAVSRQLGSANHQCGARITAQVDWDTLTDQTPEGLEASDLCDAPLSALYSLCSSPSVAARIKDQLDGVRCRLGANPGAVLQGRTLVWTGPHALRNRQPLAMRMIAAGIRWRGGETLAQVLWDEEAVACRDDRGRIVARRLVRPRDGWGDVATELLYGNDKGLKRVQRERFVPEGRFFDPRYPVDRGQGIEPRLYSFVGIPRSRAPGPCTLTCGKRSIALTPLPAEEARRLVRREPAPPVPRREPYGLARDRAGIYYYVDRAADAAKRDFQLYRGPLGRLVTMPMTNIVSDSMGDVFTTKTGSLRLVLEKETSFWIERGKRTELVNVPVQKNLPLIYNELGLYLSQPFGTPCDLF